MILDSFRDIVKHTHGLGTFEVVKVVGTDQETKIEAMTPDRGVVLMGQLKKPVNGLEGTLGLSRMSVLNGYLKFEPFATEKAQIQVVKQTRMGKEIPAELKFNSGSGHTGSYRFMAEEAVNEVVKVPRYKGATWDVVVEPTLQNLKDFIYFTSVIGPYEQAFCPVVKDGVLQFQIGGGSNDRCVIPFAQNVKGELKGTFTLPILPVIGVLKLMETGTCKMSFSSGAALQIEIDSGLGQYVYVFPGKKI